MRLMRMFVSVTTTRTIDDLEETFLLRQENRLCFSIVDSSINKQVLCNPLSHADAFRQLEKLRLTDFLASQCFEPKSQEPSLKFAALFQRFVRLYAKRSRDLL